MFSPLRFSVKNGKMKSSPMTLVAISLLIACILWQVGTVYLSKAEETFGSLVQLRMESRPLRGQQVERLLSNRDFEGDPVQYTAWTQRDEVSVGQEGLAYNISVQKVLFYSGDNQGVFQVIKEKSCAISKETAVSVFGSERDALGQPIRIEENVYHVERILADGTGGFAGIIARVSSDESMEFHVLDIGGLYAEGAAELSANDVPELSALIFREGLQGDLTIWYGSLLKWLRNPFWLPDRFIPAKWSEFEFWEQAAKVFSVECSLYFSMKRYAPDGEFLRQTAFGFGGRLLGMAGFIIGGALIFGTVRRFLREREEGFGFNYVKQACEAVCKSCSRRK